MIDTAGVALIAVRFALYLSLGAAFGLAAFSLTGSEERRRALPLRPILIGLTAASLLLSLLWLLLMAGSMSAVGLTFDPELLMGVLASPGMGAAWLARVIALAAGLVIIGFARGERARLVSSSLATGLALASLAWTGHGAAESGSLGALHLCADLLHLGAAAMWLGALLGLTLLLWSAEDAAAQEMTYDALRDFGATGTWVVATLAVTGVVNTWRLVGWPLTLSVGSTFYGGLLLAKLLLFGVMLLAAAVNRWRLTPALASVLVPRTGAGIVARLRRSVAVEVGAATLIMALVAWLGTLEPPADT